MQPSAVPRFIVPDNAKVAVIKTCLYEPQVNRTMPRWRRTTAAPCCRPSRAGRATKAALCDLILHHAAPVARKGSKKALFEPRPHLVPLAAVASTMSNVADRAATFQVRTCYDKNIVTLRIGAFRQLHRNLQGAIRTDASGFQDAVFTVGRASGDVDTLFAGRSRNDASRSR